jgi:hypothetical protein
MKAAVLAELCNQKYVPSYLEALQSGSGDTIWMCLNFIRLLCKDSKILAISIHKIQELPSNFLVLPRLF